MLITQEVAEKEVEKWLTAKRFSEKKKEAMADSIASLVNAVVDGQLLISDDGTQLTQVLFTEIGEENPIKELKYKLRISVDDIHKRMIGNSVKSGDSDGRLRVYVCALTGQSYATIGKMDSVDYGVATTIASFFF